MMDLNELFALFLAFTAALFCLFVLAGWLAIKAHDKLLLIKWYRRWLIERTEGQLQKLHARLERLEIMDQWQTGEVRYCGKFVNPDGR